MEYIDHMTSNLESNFEKCTLEKQTLSKLEKSFNQMKPHFKGQLERYLHNIDHNIEVQNAIDEKEKKERAKKEKKEEDTEEKIEEEDTAQPAQKLPLDSEQVKAVVNLVDEFNNIIAKNFSVYGQYDDFSFANTRSSDKMEQAL